MERRNYNSVYLFIGLFLVFAFMEHSPQGKIFIKNTMLDSSFWDGEIWRIISYSFIQGRDIIWLVFHLLIFIYIASPLENLWGTRYFVSLYAISVLFGGFTALLFGVPLLGGFHVDLTLMLIHGFLYPENTILLFFIFPVKIKHLAIFSSILFLLNAISFGIASGICFFVGMMSGIIYYLFTFQIAPLLKEIENVIQTGKAPETIQKMGAKELYKEMSMIAEKIEKGEATEEEENNLENLDLNVKPDRELCSPYTFSPDCDICPPCNCYCICLKRHLKNRIKENKENH